MRRPGRLRRLRRSEPELWLAALAGLAILAGLLAAGVASTWPRPRLQPFEAATGDDWGYLVLCGNCAYRARTTEHPSRALATAGGLLRCPNCGQPAARWFRRGGSVVPPGGWFATPAVPATAAAPTAGQPP